MFYLLLLVISGFALADSQVLVCVCADFSRHSQKYMTANFYTLPSPEFLSPNWIIQAAFALFFLIVEMPKV